MNTTYHYVVLRLATDDLRGEVINVGVVLFQGAAQPQIHIMATLNKLRAIDATWDTPRLSVWTENVRALVERSNSARDCIEALASFGFCDGQAIGMFIAENQTQLSKNLADVKATYVANRSHSERPQREKRTRLQTALRDQFKRMQILGTSVDDLSMHLVVQNVPVPSYPELRTDFVYKNGVYRLTQTLDYNVSPDSLHNKLSEACVKSTAAEMAVKEYGADTITMVVVDIPEEFADAADSHLDLLHARGFDIYHFNDPSSMAQYIAKAAPHATT